VTANLLKGHLDPLLLAILEDGPRHGYAIISELRRRSAGVFDLPEGTVYPALHRLERAGALTSALQPVDGRERRVYSLARAGRKSLSGRRAEWTRFAAAVDAVLGPVPV
jgi:PadR family transcriptional regulator, regulatory protein PadR